MPAAGPCRWKIFPARASMPRWSMSRTAIATGRVRCSVPPTRPLTESPPRHSRCAIAHLRTRAFARTRNPEVIGTRFGVRANARPAMTAPKKNPKQKKDQLSLAQYGDKLPANRPDPDDPGGLGAEESGTERTGPTQCPLLAVQLGGRLSEIGPYYDSANDPVTAIFAGEFIHLRHRPLAAARSRRNHAGRGVILKRRSRFF